MNIYTMENHENFKNDFNKEIGKQLGLKVFKYKDKANQSPEIKVKIDKAHIERIKEINQLDYEVYDYVKSNEKR